MGVDTRRPILSAATDSLVETSGGSMTDLSRRTDKTSYSVPDDGSPIIIPTRRRTREPRASRGDDSSKLSRASHNSQTSLLIEYFEGGKGAGSIVSRPSVRVRVTPSSSKKYRDHQRDHQRDHHLHITESSGNRDPVYARRISLGSLPRSHKQLQFDHPDDQGLSDDENHRHSRPLEIEFENREQAEEFLNNPDQESVLSGFSRDNRHLQPAMSDISSMPADSLLEGPTSSLHHKRSQSLDPEADPKELLKTPRRKRSRSLSTERIAHRVAEKLTSGPSERDNDDHSSNPRSQLDSDTPAARRRRQRAQRRQENDDSVYNPAESSLLSASAASANRRSGDQYSFLSQTSNKSSINNPKLLETVEDAIRRLILPELKELKKDQKVMHNTSKFERDLTTSLQSTGSTQPQSRDELGRRLSKHASAPDIVKPKVILNKDSKDSKDEGTTLLGDEAPPPRRKLPERKSSKDSTQSKGSEADPAYMRWGLRPELSEQDKLRRAKSKGLRDAERAGRVGTALTAAALRRHDSKSSLDTNESRQQSPTQEPQERAGGGNETELVFQKHNVPPMPLRSAFESDMTRDSLVSQRTAETESSVPPKTRLQEVSRGSPLQAPSPLSRTPNRTPLDTRYGLGGRHPNKSTHNVSVESVSDEEDRASFGENDDDPEAAAVAGDIAAAAVANLLDTHHADPARRRALSPIQSVASEQSDLKPPPPPPPPPQARPSARQGSEGDKELKHRLSIDSLSSAPSTDLARSTRTKPSGLSLNKHHQESERDHDSSRQPRAEDWDEQSDLYSRRHSAADTSSLDPRRMTNYTDDSEVDYMDKVRQGQHVTHGNGANPQFVHPAPVESAVASLLEPSVVERYTQVFSELTNRSKSDLSKRQEPRSPQTRSPQPCSPQPRSPQPRSPQPTEQQPQATTTSGSRQGSPLKQRQDAGTPDATSFGKRMGVTSPPQSIAQSIDEQAELGHSRSFDPGDDTQIPEAGDAQDSESEIDTNPSIIQGPRAPSQNQDYWPYDEESQSKEEHSELQDDKASKGLGFDEELSYDPGYYPEGAFAPEGYFDQSYGQTPGTPPAVKDEGYASGAHPLSPSVGTPKSEGKGFGGMDSLGLFDSPGAGGAEHQRNLSGYSHGAGSPLYDSATGRGVDRIQSKDIVALMDHLTVRDAQRNARDTEILVSLVRSAAEMRTSFEEMKKFIAYQDGLIMEANDKQHERTFRALGGPRPQPPSARSRQIAAAAAADEGEDMRSKRKNVFKRALKGLSLKSNNDLTRIEDMLEQLLDDVDALRNQQDDHFGRSGRGSFDQDGYETEGEAGPSPIEPPGRPSTGSRTMNGLPSRPSTVPEEDEEEERDERGEFLSPQLQSQENIKPPIPMASGALNGESTPPKSNEKAQKRKSGGFLPKFIRNTLQSNRKERSDTSLAPYGAYKTDDYYDPQGDDRIRSNITLEQQQQQQQQQQQEDRPPSPLIPSQVSEAPKYRAHRGSMDLQHPQPRQGPTGRYQTQLESQAQIYGFPNPQSEQWDSNSSLSGGNPSNAQKRYSGYSGASRLSPISDAGYSEASSRRTGPPRPPKIREDGPLIPERPPKFKEDDERSYADRVVSRSSAMRSSPVPSRKPTGPRPLNSGSQYSRTSRYRGASPDQVDDLDY